MDASIDCDNKSNDNTNCRGYYWGKKNICKCCFIVLVIGSVISILAQSCMISSTSAYANLE